MVTTNKNKGTATTAALLTSALVWAYGAGAEKVEYTLELPDIGEPKEGVTKAAHYLLFNGFKQSMADSIAGYAATLKKAGLFDKDGNAIADATRTYTDAEVHDMVIEALDERFADIKAGNVGSNNGPRLRGIDALMRDVAVEELNAAYAENKTLTKPKGEKWTALVAAYMVKNDAKLRAEAQRRQDSAKATGETAGDMLAALMAGVEKATAETKAA